MISLLVYGRNDQHGYNSHRRVALSLNAMAEVLTGPDDEILFVDYHTPHGMPTLPEAIEDTLTDRAIRLLRVLRVTPEMHAQAVGDRSRLPISEPHARNTAIRRARPGNWILSTNTDMVFVPREGRSLTDLVAELDADAYCLPRFEIPEWLWEAVPRREPGQMIDLLHDWGERIGLDEVTLGHDWILYDAPGDFQLLRRPLIEAIQGFDEEMIHGWHVDSNLWKRVYNRTGSIGTLYPDIAGYHTNHNRTLTRLMAAQPTGNDLGRFVYEVTHSELPAQAETWGFAGIDVPEVHLERAQPTSLLRAAASRAPGQTGPLITSDTREQMSVLEYDARHILPFALDPVIGEHPRPSLGYVGINDSAADMLAEAAASLDCPGGLARDDLAATDADVVVLDMGIDASTGRGPLTREEAERLLPALQRAISILRARAPRPRILLINAISGIWEPWVRAQFNLSYGTFHTRIQPAELKDEISDEPIEQGMARRLAFVTRDPDDPGECTTTDRGECFNITASETYAGLSRAWESVDEAGAYVGSEGALVRFKTATAMRGPTRVTIEMATWTTFEQPIAPVELRITLDGQVIYAGHPPTVAQIVNLHATAELDGRLEHELALSVTTADGGAYNPRMSGGTQPWVRLGSITLQPATPVALALGQREPISPGSDAEACLRGIWTKTNPFGAWNLGGSGTLELTTPTETCAVVLELLGHPGRGIDQGVRLTVSGASELVTEVAALDPNVPTEHRVALPGRSADGRVSIAFDVMGVAAPSGEIVEVRSIRIEGAG